MVAKSPLYGDTVTTAVVLAVYVTSWETPLTAIEPGAGIALQVVNVGGGGGGAGGGGGVLATGEYPPSPHEANANAATEIATQ